VTAPAVVDSLERGGLYVHLPFCPYICPYCDFAKWPMRASEAANYLRALDAEIEAAPVFSATTIFFGGGTPNTYAPSDIAHLTVRLRRRFSVPDGAEVTIELNPDRALCEGFGAYRHSGITRLSFGVQSFDEGELATLGRRHSPADVREAITRAHAAGFADISLDLIFGAPGQTVRSWEATLDAALALDPTHVSAYGLTIEPETPFAAWHAREPAAFATDTLEAVLYAIAMDRLRAAGFEHYEISNFARPGFRSRHNTNYWANGSYLGLGVGAASYLAGTRRTNTRDLRAYVAAALARRPIPGESERLEGPKRAGEAAMLALRTAEGVEFAAFAERYGIDFPSFYAAPIKEMSDAGLLEIDSSYARLTRAGRFLGDSVSLAFLDSTT
jgi:oxygen-independent coproporphyrinogen-3 oxidase